MVDGSTGQTFTLDRLAEMTAAVAGWLTGRGFGTGSVLAIILPNTPEYFAAFHGAASTGGSVTTVNPSYTSDELEFQLRDAGATIALTVPSLVDRLLPLQKTVGLREIIVIGEAPEGTTPFAELLTANPVDPVVIDPEQVVALPYSSGTTGLPKGVMLTHRNLVANLAQLPPSLGMGEEDVTIAVLPFFHIYGMTVVLNHAVQVGTTVVTMPRFDFEDFLRLTSEHRATMLFLAPPLILALAKHPLVDAYDLSSLRWIISGAAPLGAEVTAAAAERLRCVIGQGYGMTELSPVSHTTGVVSPPLGSIGHAVAGTEVRVVDPATGADRGVGEDGELWIRGPQVMKGYLGNEQATREILLDDGWLRTGDIGHVDERGDFWVVDRLKELIKVKGFQVAPAELEALLLGHPGVADAAVVGVPDDEAGERPRAFVVRRAAVEVTGEELAAFVAGHVASYKRLRDVVFIEQIPKSPSGKILRRELRD